ncbi:MAG: ATP-binding protein [Asticcacaulis sp.]
MSDPQPPLREKRRPRFNLPLRNSRLGRLILFLNIVGLVVLTIGSLVLNEFRQGLIDTQKEALTSQAELMGEVIAYAATDGVPVPQLDVGSAVFVLSRFIPREQRARLFDADGHLVSDSYTVSEGVDVRELPPVPETKGKPTTEDRHFERARDALRLEVEQALTGQEVATVRYNESGERVVSVSVPLKRVKAVLGVLTIEAGDVDKIVAAQRWAMLPFILVAVGTSIFSSLVLHWLVSRPIHRLSAAADHVRMQKSRAISLPDLEARKDEIGTLARSLESMTDTLSRRMDEIDRFAADVSHEIKNPLTSIRSALETLDLVKDDTAKARLLNVINQDVHRLDRLITDISNASRLDAELSRDTPKPVELAALLQDILSLYQHMPSESGAPVVLSHNDFTDPVHINGREGPLGQVFRNLIDNARSFSPEDGSVRLSLTHTDMNHKPAMLITVEDDGPGIPPDNLETVFQRFYTSRPKGTSFGRNSGLGLSISRQIVEAHNGRIWAENRVDETGQIAGARFIICLPLRSGPSRTGQSRK